jgi:hypothetical protein
MADRVTHASVYIGNRKVARAESSRMRGNTNGEQMITDESIFESDGKPTSEIEFTEVIPVTGIDSGALQVLLDQQDATLGFFAGGVQYKVDGRFIQFEITSQSSNGTCRGSFTFRGGKPLPS